MIIFDTSTLILLAKIEILKVITQTQEILISKEVEAEATCRPEFLDAKIIIELIKTRKIKVTRVKNPVLLKRFQDDFAIAEGEASVLLLARQKQAILATDDGQTIKACKVLGVKFVTAIHFLLSVYYKRKITRELALVKLERLKNLGRYNARIISDAVKRIEGRRKE
ncbi:MAG: hypothetical protein WA066_05945 [Candidatus Omnitrophota bacterium]